MKFKGFTIIEMMIVMLFCAIIIVLIAGARRDTDRFPQNPDGTVCVAGYKFIRYHSGEMQQVFSQGTSGVPCDAPTER